MRGYSNLPPDVSVSMLPGCRPQDEAFDVWAEQVERLLSNKAVEAINADSILEFEVDEKFFQEFDYHDPESPDSVAERIEEYVEQYTENQ